MAKARKRADRPVRPLTIDFNDEATLAYVRELAARGMWEKDIAQCLGYDRTYFVELKKKHPELSKALKLGKSQGIEKVTGVLMDEIEARNTATILFYLKAKAGWRDNAPEVDDSGDEGDSQSIGQRVLDGVRKLRNGGHRDGSGGVTD
jgi:hypothetical protein